MNKINIDYNLYPFQISEIPHVDWEGLGFNLIFSHPLNEKEKEVINDLLKKWFTNGQLDEDHGFDFISNLEWGNNEKSLKWWIDMGSTDKAVLENLFEELSVNKGLISELILGR